jgi:hypothetical protein
MACEKECEYGCEHCVDRIPIEELRKGYLWYVNNWEMLTNQIRNSREMVRILTNKMDDFVAKIRVYQHMIVYPAYLHQPYR